MAREVRIDEAERYVQKLGIAWQVKFIAFGAGEDISGAEFESPMIVSSAKERVHEIRFGESWLSGLFNMRHIAHELCHAKLAEAINPLFATARFHPNSSKDLGRYFDTVSNPVLDIWVDDALFAVDRELTITSARSVQVMLRARSSAGERGTILTDNSLFLSYAIKRAFAVRHGVSLERGAEDEALLRSLYGTRGHDLCRRLWEHCARLPRLRLKDKKGSLGKLERAIQKAIRIFRFPVAIRLVWWRGERRWLIKKES